MLATRMTLATAAAMVAATGTVAEAAAQKAAPKDGDVVHCYGINTCKGSSDCKTASNACKGQNDCKGQGFKAITVKACKAAGGSLTEK